MKKSINFMEKKSFVAPEKAIMPDVKTPKPCDLCTVGMIAAHLQNRVTFVTYKR
jgi:hypothetical protein